MINWLFLCNCFLYVTVHVMMAEEKWFLQLNITKYILYIMICKILLIIILLFSLSF